MSKKDAFYFSHDCNARHDPKIIKLCTKYGLEGYGFYFCLLEIMRESADYAINISDIETISYQLHLTTEKANDLINYCIAINLLLNNGNQIYSESFVNRMRNVDDMRKKQSENGKKGGRPKTEENPNESEMKASENPNESLKENKTKQEEINKKNNNTFVDKEKLKSVWIDEFSKIIKDRKICSEDFNGAGALKYFESTFDYMQKNKINSPEKYLIATVKKVFDNFIERFV